MDINYCDKRTIEHISTFAIVITILVKVILGINVIRNKEVVWSLQRALKYKQHPYAMKVASEKHWNCNLQTELLGIQNETSLEIVLLKQSNHLLHNGMK